MSNHPVHSGVWIKKDFLVCEENWRDSWKVFKCVRHSGRWKHSTMEHLLKLHRQEIDQASPPTPARPFRQGEAMMDHNKALGLELIPSSKPRLVFTVWNVFSETFRGKHPEVENPALSLNVPHRRLISSNYQEYWKCITLCCIFVIMFLRPVKTLQRFWNIPRNMQQSSYPWKQIRTGPVS